MDLAARIPALLVAARVRLGGAGGPRDSLSKAELAAAAKAVLRLHEGLVGERALASVDYLAEPALLAAYLLLWWPLTYAKARGVLAEAGVRGRVLDLGAGPGPLALAALDAGATFALAVDRSAPALAAAVEVSRGAALETSVADFGVAPARGKFDAILLGNLLNELAATTDERAAALRKLADAALAPGGVIVALDPALRSTGRDLLEVRDRLVGSGFVALAPCIRQGPCPALERARDWCHAGRPWTPPAHVVQLDTATGLDHASLKFSYLVLARTGERDAPALRAGDLERFRVVSDPLPEKGKLRVFGCGERGRVGLTRLEREAPEDDPLSRAVRGDVVRVGGATPKGDGLRLGPGAAVEVEA